MTETGGPWSRELASIDEQHESLEQGMAGFLEAVRQGRPTGELDHLLHGIIRQLEEHFRLEEVLMVRAGFPELHPHRLLHQSCLGQLRQERDSLALRGPKGLDTYREHTQVWIHKHMARQDQRFVDFLCRLDIVPELGTR
jgi:hemerythrin-like metal-binding protein